MVLPAGEEKYFLGIDVGSVSANTVVMSSQLEVVEEHYHRLHGQPIPTVRRIVDALFQRIPSEQFVAVSFVGTGGKLLAHLLEVEFFNEVIAQCRAIDVLYPQVRTIIEMGGEDSKLILRDSCPRGGKGRLADFSMNAMCAAGTGSFLDQQASRLNLTIEEFGTLALKSENPPRIAGRCSVFAKSDMIHLQQIAAAGHDIVAGLCFAVARNFKSTIGKGLEFRPPVAFQGGVAANMGMRRALAEILELGEGDFLIPRYFASMGAIGACVLASEAQSRPTPWKGWDKVDEYLAAGSKAGAGAQPLPRALFGPAPKPRVLSATSNTDRIKGYLGVDVGSISTNVVVIDEHKQVVAKRYLMTAGRPIEAIKQGLKEIGEEIGARVEILGAGTTGSGRYLTGDFIGADVVRNEITAQATAAAQLDPQVDTIFEIGGQDSKYISLHNGVVVDFEMNKVCAAGTGSFLEEQAEKLGISIQEEFGSLALQAVSPVSLGERCTVFMESDLVHHQQQGAAKEDLVAGLCYSIVHNYLNKVVGKKRIGERIFFQGGTAFNRGVVAAFEKVLGRPITVPPHNEVTGALGAAILAMEENGTNACRFKGFDLSGREYRLSSLECQDCTNRCEIRTLEVKGEPPLFYGSRCGKHDVQRKGKVTHDLPDLFQEREELLHRFRHDNDQLPSSAPTIGFPRALFFHELLPFWAAYFNSLGYRVVLSEKTNKTLIRQGVEVVPAEPCFPIKVTYGHLLDLINQGVTRIFLPSLVTLARAQQRIPHSFACPYVQSIPYTVKSAIDFARLGVELIHLPVFLGRDSATVEKGLKPLALQLGRSIQDNCRAFARAEGAQQQFVRALQARGREILAGIEKGARAMVIISRPYNGCDQGINLRIPQKLRDMGVLSLPLDMLPLEQVDLSARWSGMYWAYGQKILAAAALIRQDPRLFAVYLTNFSCGPDSFISHFFQRELGDKPSVQIEIDEHSADAGVITRLEAFLDSLRNLPPQQASPTRASRRVSSTGNAGNGTSRTVFLPRMNDHAHVLAAAFHACGTPAQVMPESDAETLRLGRKYTSGRECYPCILTTGNMVKLATSAGFDPDRSAFFMPSSNGPCRFGQYAHLQGLVLQDLGFPQVPVFGFNQDDRMYHDFQQVGKRFSRLAWQGIVAVDLLGKRLREIRPYERTAGEADRVYGHYLDELCAELRAGKDPAHVLRLARRDLAAVRDKDAPARPVIGIVGEIYIRSNCFSNEDIVRELETLGAEVWLPPIGEWVLYTNFTALRNSFINRRWPYLLKTLVTTCYQRYDEHRLEKIVGNGRGNYPEPTTRKLLRNAASYLDSTFEGEAILSIGKAVDFVGKGVSGIVNVMPFTCMPGTIVHSLLKKFRESTNSVPVLSMAYDGQEQTTAKTRLEAFSHQVRQFHQERCPSA